MDDSREVSALTLARTWFRIAAIAVITFVSVSTVLAHLDVGHHEAASVHAGHWHATPRGGVPAPVPAAP